MDRRHCSRTSYNGVMLMSLSCAKTAEPALSVATLSIGASGREVAVKDRTTKSGESWTDLNKRRGRLAAIARKQHAAIRQQIDRESRARRITANGGASDERITRALGARFHIHIARTVLSALREPTLGMVEAAHSQIDDAGKWRAMVDVAVRELDGTY